MRSKYHYLDINKNILCVFYIMDQIERVNKINELQNQLSESINNNTEKFQGEKGEILLLEATKHGDFEFANEILRNDNGTVDINVTDEKGNTPLTYAIFYKNPEFIKLLLFRGAKISENTRLFLERNKDNSFVPVFNKMYKDLMGGKIKHNYKNKHKKHTKKYKYRKHTNKGIKKYRKTRRY